LARRLCTNVDILRFLGIRIQASAQSVTRRRRAFDCSGMPLSFATRPRTAPLRGRYTTTSHRRRSVRGWFVRRSQSPRTNCRIGFQSRGTKANWIQIPPTLTDGGYTAIRRCARSSKHRRISCDQGGDGVMMARARDRACAASAFKKDAEKCFIRLDNRVLFSFRPSSTLVGIFVT